MIRLLAEADRSAVVSLLEQAPYLNLYMLGNLEILGFEQEFCQFWGDFGSPSGDRALRGVINRYMQGWTLFGLADADWPALAQVLDHHPLPAQRLQDNPGGTSSLLPYLARYEAAKVSESQLMDLDPADFQPAPPPPGVVVRRATLDDLDALVAFYADAEQMTRTPAAVARPLQDTRVWIAEVEAAVEAEVEGTPAAAALTNAETRSLAMVGGVYTKPAWRNRGLSRAVCSALCAELIAAGKRPVLYWDRPAAGAVYRRLGFQARGVWRSVWLAQRRLEA